MKSGEPMAVVSSATSTGVTKAVKSSAVAVTTSHRRMNLLCGWTMHASIWRSCLRMTAVCLATASFCRFLKEEERRLEATDASLEASMEATTARCTWRS